MHERAHPGSVAVRLRRREGALGPFEEDTVVVEEPLEVRLREGEGTEPVRFLVTMRTPGHDEDLGVGLLYGEGAIDSGDEVLAVDRLDDPRTDPDVARNVVIVTLAPRPGSRRLERRRAAVMTSACGVCGQTSIESVMAMAEAGRCRAKGSGSGGPTDVPLVPASVLVSLPPALRREQALFSSTGGLHAAAFFEPDGTLVVAREDVGRHNATDKALGALLRLGRPVPPLLLVSGRPGFEIVQKAALAGVAIVASVSAPTSLAVELADEARITLVGFLRGERFNVYTHAGRVDGSA